MTDRNLYAELREVQRGLCGICGQPPSNGASLVVDHDHDSGMVRGLLCPSCNNLEGKHSCTARDCLPGFCAVEMWRRAPAVSWVGWTERYESGFNPSDDRGWNLERPWYPTARMVRYRQVGGERSRQIIGSMFSDVQRLAADQAAESAARSAATEVAS